MKKLKNNKTALISLCLTLLLVMIFFIIKKITPFGNYSLIIEDANNQHYEILLYYKNLLVGNNNLLYSLSNGFGASCLSMFSYYLASPVNLLMIFFKFDSIVTFYSISYMIKLALSACFMSIFITKRFNNKVNNNINIALSIAYAFCNYTLNQYYNLMWLDGVYMLPLLCLGTYYLIENNNPKLLLLSNIVMFFSNWYIGFINLIFVSLYFLAELVMLPKKKFKFYIKKCFQYGTVIISGLLTLMFFLLPVFFEIRAGRGYSDIDFLYHVSTNWSGNPLNVIYSYRLNKTSFEGCLATYTGSLVLLGLFNFIFAKNINKKEKIVLTSLLILMILTCYYYPLWLVVNLFKASWAFYFRNGFQISFMLIFITSFFFAKNTNSSSKACNISIIFYIIAMSASMIIEKELLYAFVSLILLIMTALYGVVARKHWGYIILVSLEVVIGIYINSDFYFNYYDIGFFTKIENEVIEQIKKSDSSLYRINKLIRRINYPFINNYSLAYNYNGNITYTSTTSQAYEKLLQEFGYIMLGHVLPVAELNFDPYLDSFAGNKYVISTNELPVYKFLFEKNDYKVYENQYSLGIAYKASNLDFNPTDPEIRDISIRNELALSILGYYPYEEVEPVLVDEETNIYRIEDIDPERYLYYISYLNFDSNNASVLVSSLDGSKQHSINSMNTGFFLNPSDILLDDFKIEYFVDKNNTIKIFRLDLPKFLDSIKEYQSKRVDDIRFENYQFTISTNNIDDEYLVLTIPFTNDFEIKVNDKLVEPLNFKERMAIPLEIGRNDIVMTYHEKGAKAGIILSIVGLLSSICLILFIKKKSQ